MLLLVAVWIDDSSIKGLAKIANGCVLLFFYWLIIFINYRFLFTQYLREKKFVTYLLFLALATALLTPLRALFAGIVGWIFGADISSIFSGSLITVFGTLYIVGIISTLVRIFSDWMKYNRIRSQLEKQNMQSELKFLKSQVNPHFLFNTLNSLYALTLKKSDLAPEIVIKLSEMMRYMLYECNELFVPLEKEINYLRNYIELERLRHGDHLKIDFQLTGQVNHQKIAPLLFLPFIENSFKHGISKTIEQGYVKVFLDINEQEIGFGVDNSKTSSMPNPEKKISGGIGLMNVKRRLDLIYPSQYDLQVFDNPNNYKVILKLNINQNFYD
jgi:LytS/YehU family sensor histidine kinase